MVEVEVEPAGQRGRNGNEAVVGAASEAFAGRLHCRYAPWNCLLNDRDNNSNIFPAP